ncbi:MAG: hypothetical protein MJ231_04085 [bacterium]|nr:hypothetical protein [bacterium]
MKRSYEDDYKIIENRTDENIKYMNGIIDYCKQNSVNSNEMRTVISALKIVLKNENVIMNRTAACYNKFLHMKYDFTKYKYNNEKN